MTPSFYRSGSLSRRPGSPADYEIGARDTLKVIVIGQTARLHRESHPHRAQHREDGLERGISVNRAKPAMSFGDGPQR
jgi:hypothetical protein